MIMKKLTGAKSIPNRLIKNFIMSLNPMKDLYDLSLGKNFLNEFVEWIQQSDLNQLHNLELFKYRTLTCGTIQIFDHFYLRHIRKRFRIFKGEFMYHKAVLKNGGSVRFVEDGQLEKNDVLIMSVPFSDFGYQRHDTEEILEKCTKLKIPVLLDLAYYPITKDINLNLEHDCIETIGFSLSKAFYGCEWIRMGIRFQRQSIDDGIDVFNSVEMVNNVSISLSKSLIKEYSVDYNWNKYEKEYKTICKKLNLTETKCVLFGLGGKEYTECNRGGFVNRVTIADYYSY